MSKVSDKQIEKETENETIKCSAFKTHRSISKLQEKIQQHIAYFICLCLTFQPITTIPTVSANKLNYSSAAWFQPRNIFRQWSILILPLADRQIIGIYNNVPACCTRESSRSNLPKYGQNKVTLKTKLSEITLLFCWSLLMFMNYFLH